MELLSFRRGQAVITTVLFLLFISTAVALGVSSSVSRSIRATEEGASSRQGFFVAESGIEDIVYRFKTGKQTPSSETLGAGGATTTVTVTDLGAGQKEILSAGDLNTYIRKIKARLVTTSGASFVYSVQVGAGGLHMGNNAGVVGNIYSNGDIEGGSGAYITGSAVAANSSALAADAHNDAPIPPPADIDFGQSSASQDFAQSFAAGTTSPLHTVELYLKRTGSPSNLSVRLVADDHGAPSDTTIVSASLSASLVTTSYGWVQVAFPEAVELIEGTTYWLVLDGTTGSASKHYSIGANSAYGSTSARLGQHGGAWSAAGYDGYFRVYLGGKTGVISGVVIGTGSVGNAWAHTVTNSTIAGINYCKTGSGNNKSCTTSQADPTQEAFAVSEANIAAWKSEAAAGTLIQGNYSLSDRAASLGLTHITGNLSLDNNSTLTLTGTLWVSGTISLSNGSKIVLSSAYGTASGIIVADGPILISNNGTFQGSGQNGSYVLALSTSACPNEAGCDGNAAIDVSNNAGTVILYAPYGTLHLANNSGAKEVTASRIDLDNGAVISYETGLVDIRFTSGPTGAYSIDAWREVR